MLYQTEIMNSIYDMLKRTGESDWDLSFMSYRPGFTEGPYLTVSGNVYILGHFEKGIRRLICRTEDIDVLRYEIIKMILFEKSAVYVVRNKKKYTDQRRLMFQYELEMMEKIDPAFTEKLKAEIDEVLVNHPYNDRRSYPFDCMDAYKRLLPLLIKGTHGPLKREIKEIISALDKKPPDFMTRFRNATRQIKAVYAEILKKNKYNKELLDELGQVVSYADDYIALSNIDVPKD